MERDHNVKVIELARLRSEMAMYIWTQSEMRRGRKVQPGIEPEDRTAFMLSKATLIQEAVQLADQKISLEELISRLKVLIDQAAHVEIQSLDPKNIALKISGRVGGISFKSLPTGATVL